jgi:hypothetical protein
MTAAACSTNVKTAQESILVNFLYPDNSVVSHRCMSGTELLNYIKDPKHLTIPKGTSLTIYGWAKVQLPLLFQAMQGNPSYKSISLAESQDIESITGNLSIPSHVQSLTVFHSTHRLTDQLKEVLVKIPNLTIVKMFSDSFPDRIFRFPKSSPTPLLKDGKSAIQ